MVTNSSPVDNQQEYEYQPRSPDPAVKVTSHLPTPPMGNLLPHLHSLDLSFAWILDFMTVESCGIFSFMFGLFCPTPAFMRFFPVVACSFLELGCIHPLHCMLTLRDLQSGALQTEPRLLQLVSSGKPGRCL